jgi:hypothetical protein
MVKVIVHNFVEKNCKIILWRAPRFCSLENLMATTSQGETLTPILKAEVSK